jgi:zinc/manganese transport system substrate-binding protein
MYKSLTGCALLLVAGCTSAHAPTGSGHRVGIVAAENVWGDVARQIGGQHVRVTSIITDPSADPHTYESSVRDAAALGRAQLVIVNGAGYDDFAAKLLAANPVRGRATLTVATVVGLRGSDPNPHLWYSPTYVTAAATAIERQLAHLDPADSAGFSTGLQHFLSSYQPYISTLAQIRSRHAGAAVAYTERVPGYLVQAAGLTLGSPASFAQSVEDGDDPSAADTVAMTRALTTHAVKVLLYNSQVTDPVTDHVEQVARSVGVPVVGVAETIPAGFADLQDWQLHQARAILTALGG